MTEKLTKKEIDVAKNQARVWCELTKEDAMEKFTKLIKINNQIVCNKAVQKDFDDYLETIIDDWDIKYDGIMGVLAERATLTEEWIKENKRFVQLSKKLFSKFSEKQMVNCGSFRTSLRVLLLDEFIKKFGDAG